MDDSQEVSPTRARPEPPRLMLWLCLPWLLSVAVAALVLGQWVELSAQVGWAAFWIAFLLGAGLVVAAIILGARRHQANLLIVLAIPVIATAAGHWGTPPAPLGDAQRVANPSGTLEAVIANSLTGSAHVPTVVLVTPRGGAPNARRPVFTATRVEGLAVQWRGEAELSIRIRAGKTFVRKAAVAVGGRRVVIRYD